MVEATAPPNKVFIAWSGDIGRALAEGLKDIVLDPQKHVEGWVSSVDIAAGSQWFTEVNKALDQAAYGIGILTPGAAAAPWVNFEAGFLYGRLRNFKLLRFERTVLGPLSNLQPVDATTEQGIAKLLGDILPSSSIAAAWAKEVYPKWKDLLDAQLGHDAATVFSTNIHHHVGQLAEAILTHAENSTAGSNRLLQQTVIESMEFLRQHIAGATRFTYSLPASDYPEYLSRLQRFKVRVSAIALVDHRERFWQQEQGRRILANTARDSERVFVFLTPEDLARSFDTILAHARKYTVAVLSYQRLARESPDCVRDFVIIQHDSEKLLGVYEETGRVISFVADVGEIARHEEEFTRILRHSTPVDPDENPRVEDLVHQVFEELTAYPKRPVEMSAYIPEVDEYDAHEEEHAYYVDMMEEMIAIIEAFRGTKDRPLDVLEFGAGTGLFTKRIAALPNVNVTAIELDWAYYTRLKHNVRSQGTHCYNEDSRFFSPPGRFDLIVSSFSDHHIPLSDKKKYFNNVKMNLVSDSSLFIVGDEFLPDHDLHNKMDRMLALEKYHGHIIGLARSKGQEVLERLECAALKSGLAALDEQFGKIQIREAGDYKVSCRQYEEFLVNNGLAWQRKVLIGPKDHFEALGGIYVYVIGVRKGSAPTGNVDKKI